MNPSVPVLLRFTYYLLSQIASTMQQSTVPPQVIKLLGLLFSSLFSVLFSLFSHQQNTSTIRKNTFTIS